MSKLDPRESPLMRMIREGALKVTKVDRPKWWGMFRPLPTKINGWLIIGELENGCNVLRKGETILEMFTS